jgi:hypothetical protein
VVSVGTTSAYAELRERNIAEINAAFKEQFGYDRFEKKQQQIFSNNNSSDKPPPTPTKQAEQANQAKAGNF